MLFMQSEIILNAELVEKLSLKSEETGINFNDLANKILDEGLENYDDDKIFEERTRKALERVEARGVNPMSSDDFLKELESW